MLIYPEFLINIFFLIGARWLLSMIVSLFCKYWNTKYDGWIIGFWRTINAEMHNIVVHQSSQLKIIENIIGCWKSWHPVKRFRIKTLTVICFRIIEWVEFILENNDAVTITGTTNFCLWVFSNLDRHIRPIDSCGLEKCISIMFQFRITVFCLYTDVMWFYEPLGPDFKIVVIKTLFENPNMQTVPQRHLKNTSQDESVCCLPLYDNDYLKVILGKCCMILINYDYSDILACQKNLLMV